MKCFWVEMILMNIENWRTELIALSPRIAENRIRELLNIDKTINIRILGGFDTKIIYLTNRVTSECYIISISKSLMETSFYASYHENINQVTKFSCQVKSDSFFANRISNQFSVGLISLAKREVYTYPRFALGISDIAYALRNQFLSDVHLFDLQLINQNELLEILRKSKFNVIGISMTFGLFDVMKCLVSEILTMESNVKIIIGGSLAAIIYTEILNLFPNVIVSLGEGEICMTQVIEWLCGNIELNDIPNIAFINDIGEIITTKHEPPVPNMFLPELDLLIDTIHEKGVFQLETSRGCYNACSFCPRQHKGYWKPLFDDEKKLELFLTIYSSFLTLNNIDPMTQTIYVVDEEFIGKECNSNRIRTKQICSLFNKYGIPFEVSFRMNAIFSSTSCYNEEIEMINNIRAIHNCGLNRVLVGVESGVDSVLLRFNKHVSSFENTQGIRILTALGVPVRFTYITFDPLMSFDELIETYRYQGRTDLIIDHNKVDTVYSLLEKNIDEDIWNDISLGIPFYYYIPYMLVSLECLIGSKYYMDLEELKLLESSTITSLGKKNARYIDSRIGIMSRFSQLWIDRNFSLDYTLKSFGKIYPIGKSEQIRTVRTKLKENAYRLLGKLIFLFNQDSVILRGQPSKEVEFMKNFCGLDNREENTMLSDNSIFNILNYQFDVLTTEIDAVNPELAKLLSEEDYYQYCKHYNNWKENCQWRLINYD